METSLAISNSSRGLPAPRHPARLAARIGGVSLGLTSDAASLTLEADPGVQEFLVDDQRCDIELKVSLSRGFGPAPGELLFDSCGLWQVFRKSEGYCFRFTTAHLGPEPYKQATVLRDFASGRIELLRSCFPTDRPVYPLEYPLDELLWIHRLAQGEGVEVHACGLVTPEGRGLLLTGHSGAGKSTSARLWSRRESVRVLSDDRIILRRRAGRVWMHGTPWHGDADFAEAAAWPLDAVFILAHGPANKLRRLHPAAASAELYARSFVPHYLPESVSFVLRFFDQLTSEIPCREFAFVPDFAAVEALLHEDI